MMPTPLRITDKPYSMRLQFIISSTHWWSAELKLSTLTRHNITRYLAEVGAVLVHLFVVYFAKPLNDTKQSCYHLNAHIPSRRMMY